MNELGYDNPPQDDPPSPPVVSDTFWATVSSSTDLGSGRWSYTITEAAKTTAAYGGWSTLTGGRAGTAYNAMEDPGSAPQEIADDTPVLVREVVVSGQAAPEYWIIATRPAAASGGSSGFDQIITHNFEIPADLADGEFVFGDTDMRGKLECH